MQRVGVVRVRPGVVHDAVLVAMGRMQPIDERALMVRLEAVDLAAMLGPVGTHHLLDGLKRVRAINSRITHPQHIQVRPIHEQYLLQQSSPLSDRSGKVLRRPLRASWRTRPLRNSFHFSSSNVGMVPTYVRHLRYFP